MENDVKNCYNEDHPKAAAIYYCVDCKLFMCNVCNNFHSKLFKKHNKIALDKNKDISQIFSGFCKEKNHFDKLDYFCKTHNQLCCSGCISKIKLKDKGQHGDCEICSLDDIKENKEKILKENILNLEKLSKEMDTLINEMKVIFEKINKDKEELKLKIQTTFTKIRNSINDREDKILSKVEELYDNIYIQENEIKTIDKYPNKIKEILILGKSEIEKWNNNKNSNELSSFVNNCINIEKLLLDINDKEKNLKRCKNEMTSVIKFSPSEGDELNAFISKLTSFGQIYKETGHIQTKTLEENTIDLEIKSIKKKPNGLSIKLFCFSDEECKNYYPNDAVYEEDEIILTINLDAKNEFINKIFENKENFENSLKEMIGGDLSMRKSKLILDLKANDKETDKEKDKDLFNFFIFLNHFQILMNFQNNFAFEKLKEMNFEEFSKIFTSFNLSLTGGFKNLAKKYFDKEFMLFLKLMVANNLKFKWDIQFEKIFALFEEEGLIKEIKSYYNNYKEKVEGEIVNVIAPTLENSFSTKMSEDIAYDQILITLFFAKYKSGFVLDIKSKGINDYLKKLI